MMNEIGMHRLKIYICHGVHYTILYTYLYDTRTYTIVYTYYLYYVRLKVNITGVIYFINNQSMQCTFMIIFMTSRICMYLRGASERASMSK